MPLTIRVVSPVEGARLDGTVNVTLETTGTPDTVELRVDGATVASGTSTVLAWNTATASEGAHTLSVLAQRGADQALSPPVSVVVDRTLPVLTAPTAGTALDAEGPLRVTFNKAVAASSIQGDSLQLFADGARVNVTVEADADARGATLRFLERVSVPAAAELRVSGVTDEAGHALTTVVALTVPAWLGETLSGVARVQVRGTPEGVYAAGEVPGGVQVWRVEDGKALPDGAVLAGATSPLLLSDDDAVPTLSVVNAEGIQAFSRRSGMWVAVGAPLAGFTRLKGARKLDGEAWLAAWDGTRLALHRWTQEGWVEAAAVTDAAVQGEGTLFTVDNTGPVLLAGLQGYRVALPTGVLTALPTLVPTSMDAQVLALAVQWEGSLIAAVREAGVLRTRVLGNLGWNEEGLSVSLDVGNRVGSAAVECASEPQLVFEEQDHRGWHVRVARWRGNAWDYLGPDVAVNAASGPVSVTLDRLGRPVVAVAQGDGVFVGRLNARSSLGALRKRGALTGCTFPEDPAAADFPRTASATGCYADTATQTLAPGVVSYSVNAQLYSDGETKLRYLALPEGTSMTYVANGPLAFPDGTVLIKEFHVKVNPADPQSTRILETRFMVKRSGNIWDGFSYAWAADGSDATLVPQEGSSVSVPLEGGGSHAHGYPGRSDCLACHTSASRRTLGMWAAQLNRVQAYADGTENQLAAWTRAGLLTGTETTPPRIPPVHDLAAPVPDRARAYLHANCSSCHRSDGPNPAWDARYTTPLADSMMCGNNRLVPGMPGASTMAIRMRQLAPMGLENPMPPLARTTVDHPGVGVVEAWITGLGTCP